MTAPGVILHAGHGGFTVAEVVLAVLVSAVVIGAIERVSADGAGGQCPECGAALDDGRCPDCGATLDG